MKIDGNSIRPGNVLEYKNRLWRVTKTQHVKPGKGGAFMQVEMKDVRDGTKLNERFRSSETVERARLDRQTCSYLYSEGDLHTFMDQSNYEQITLHSDMIGEPVAFLQENMEVAVELHEGSPISVELPEHATVAVKKTEAVVKGQTAASPYKPAVLENGVRTSVPPFIASGERVVVTTADGTYVERAKS